MLRNTKTLREIAYEMKNIGASSMTPHELFRFWAKEIEKTADRIDEEVEILIAKATNDIGANNGD